MNHFYSQKINSTQTAKARWTFERAMCDWRIQRICADFKSAFIRSIRVISVPFVLPFTFYLLPFTFLLLPFTLHSQSVGIFGSTNLGVNSTGAHGNPSSVFDISSTTGGLLIPRMTTVQRNTLTANTPPETSLLIFNTSTNQYEYWDGASWVAIATAAANTNWSLTGNASTVDGTNFIGTTDNVPFNIRVNNLKAGRIYPTDLMTVFGYQALNTNQGYGVVAIGHQALMANTRNDGLAQGWGNVAVGYQSMLSNTLGSYNTAIGNATLQNNTSGKFNTAFGNSALAGNTGGSSNTALGTGALSATTGSWNTAVGDSTGKVITTGTKNIFIGYNADATVNSLTNAIAIGAFSRVGASNAMVLGGTGANAVNVGIGTTAPASMLSVGASNQFQINSTGNIIKLNNVTTSFPAANASGVLKNDGAGTLTWEAAAAAGWSLTGNTGTVDGTNFIGTTDNVPFNIRVNNQKAGRIDPLTDNTFFGQQAGNAITTGVVNTAFGRNALLSNNSGSENAAIGMLGLGQNTTGSYNIALGSRALYSNVTGSNATAIGYQAMYYANNTATPFTNFNVAVGYEALRGSVTAANNTGNYNTALGYQTLMNNTSGNDNTTVGTQSGINNTTGFFNTFIGKDAGYNSSTSSINTFVGARAGYSNSGSGNDANSFFGYSAGYQNTSGFFNTFLGASSGNNNQTGSRNIFIGATTAYNSTGSFNTIVGTEAAYFSTSGDYNTLLGAGSGGSANPLGNYNTYLGYNARGSASLANATAIGKNAEATTSNSLILGGTGADAVNVGIGTTLPLATLDITRDGGTVLFPRKSSAGDPAGAANGMIYYNSNSNKFRIYENGAWVDVIAGGGSSWLLSGNGGTVDGTNFIGTTDDIPFNIRVNNQKSGRIETNSGTGNNNANTFLGYFSGNSKTTGSGNTASGLSSLFSNTTGSGNTAYGTQALYSNVAGSNATAVGWGAMQYANDQAAFFANYNVAVGYEALRGSGSASANTGNYNTALGYQTLLNNSSGGYNTASGNDALYNNTTGGSNTATGAFSLSANTSASLNTAVGRGALFSQSYNPGFTWNSENVAIGYSALYSNQPTGTGNGIQNTAVGNQALWSNSTGRSNTALGNRAGYTATPANANTTGSYNVFIGYNSGPGVPSASSLQNSIAIGKNALVDVSNTLILGGTGADAVNVGIGTTAPSVIFDVNGTDAIKIPSGTTAQRPATAANGMFRYNTINNKFECYENGAWADMVAGAGSSPWSRTAPNTYLTTGTDNVGIGTTTPFRKLHVEIAGSEGLPGDAGNVVINNNDFAAQTASLSIIGGTTGLARLSFGHATVGLRGVIDYENSNNNMVFKTNTVEAMRINNLGFVGVGATAPSSLFHVQANTATPSATVTTLTMSHNVSAGGGANGIGTQMIFQADNDADVMRNAALIGGQLSQATSGSEQGTLFFQTANGASLNEAMRINYLGNVGIGTTSPGARLHVKQSTSNVDVIRIEDDDTGDRFGIAYVWENPNPSLRTNYNGTDLLTIQNSGNVGIGITSPLAKLHLADNVQNGIISQVSSAANFPYFAAYRSRGTVGAESAILNNDMIGGILFLSHNGTASGDAAYIFSKATENHATGRGSELQFHTTTNTIGSPTQKMVIANDGNIGIGTTAPGAKLDIFPSTGAAINIQPYGGGAGQTGELRFYETIANAEYVGFKAPDFIVANRIWTLPAADGANGDVLTTNGSGVLNWSPVSGTLSGGTANYIPVWTSPTSLGNSSMDDNGTRVSVGTMLSVGAGSPPAGQKLFVEESGASGRAGRFSINNAANADEAVYASTSGTGKAGDFQINNAANASPALGVTTNGTGHGGQFQISNSSSAVYATNSGGGNAVYGLGSGSGNVIYGKTTGTGMAGVFELSNTALSADAVFVTTNGFNSKALDIRHTGTTGIGTNYGAYSLVNGARGAGSTNVGGYFSASGATNNYAAIFENGNVGIGTTAPTEQLHVLANVVGNNTILIENTNGAGNARMLVKAPLGLGIAFGMVSGASQAGGLSTDGAIVSLESNTNIPLRFGTNGVEQMRILTNGNVGIGTTAPKGKLHIVGDAALGDGTAANEGVVTVFLTNNTGVASVKGEIVIVDPAVNNAFVKTTTAGHTSVIGVVYESGVASGAPCRIAISGIVSVIADAGTTRGQHCITGTATAGAAGSVATPGSGTSIGVWLENVAVSAQGKVLLR